MSRQVEVTTEKWDMNDNGGTQLENTIETGCFVQYENFVEGDFSKTYALVEFLDGTVRRVEIETIRFTGRPCGASMFEEGLEK